MLLVVNMKLILNSLVVCGIITNKTVFEWVTSALGAQGTVCGGGRYDGLVEQLMDTQRQVSDLRMIRAFSLVGTRS